MKKASKGTAQFIGYMRHPGDGPIKAALFKVNPPLPYTKVDGELNGSTTEYVVSSASCIPDVPETFLFATDSTGKWLSRLKMDGSERGPFDLSKPFENIGYTIKWSNEKK